MITSTAIRSGVRNMIESINAEVNDAYDFLSNERDVESLVHFTPIENLKSILENGLIPHKMLPAGANVIDSERLDRMTDCNCLSVTFPNNFMLYSKSNLHSFVILRISPEIIRDKGFNDVYFMPSNAARHEFLGKHADFRGLTAAKKMFYNRAVERNGGVVYFRNVLGIPENYSTDPQAEILVRGVIPPEYITGIVFKSDFDAELARITLDSRYHSLFEVDESLFGKRIDTAHWQKRYYY